MTSSYDDVPYESHPYPQAHPSRLFSVATLFGLSPVKISHARVLEIGSAAGGHLIPLAEQLPEAQFLGVDLSARQIADGKRTIQTLGLKNIELLHADLSSVDATFGQFDYVICHGVFSWVPDDIRNKILAICRERLSSSGVAYVSYNTFPGWHLRGMVRDVLQYHTSRFTTPEEKLSQTRSFIEFLARSVRREGAYGGVIQSELEVIRKQADHYLFHEYLEDDNEPLYFHQFIAMARKHGLGYLGESRIGTMIAGNFGPEVEKMLADLSLDQIQTEQHLDFIRNRTFRETLLVHSEQEPRWEIDASRLESLHLASDVKQVGKPRVGSRQYSAQQYRGRTGLTISTSQPLVQAALSVLAECWPGTIPFLDLLSKARQVVEIQGGSKDDLADSSALSFALMNIALSSELIELHGAPIAVERLPPDKPTARYSARLRVAQNERSVTNWRHELIHLDEMEQLLLPRLDGTRGRSALLDFLVEQAQNKQLQVARLGKDVGKSSDLHSILGLHLDRAIESLTERALFKTQVKKVVHPAPSEG